MLGGYIVLLPHAKVLTFIVFILREVPAVLFLGVWFGFQLLEGSTSIAHPEAGGGVAFFAHIGGFVFGLPPSSSSRSAARSRPGLMTR